MRDAPGRRRRAANFPEVDPVAPRPTGRTIRRLARRLGRGLWGVADTWGEGYRRLAESHAASAAGDVLVAVGLAGTLFFSVPSTEARANVALYLVLTLAPFAVLGPALGRLFERSPGAYRGGMALSALGRAIVALGLLLSGNGLLLFPLAFTLLVLSRFHGISRASILPVVVRDAGELVEANARLARFGVLVAALVVPVGGALAALVAPAAALVPAILAYLVAGVAAVQLPRVARRRRRRPGVRPRRGRVPLPRRVRLARFATAGVRFLNGFLLLLVAFAFREVGGVVSLSALLVAAGVGYYLAAWVAPALGTYVSEEPMVVIALAVEAGAAFIGAQVFSLGAGMVLAAAAGFAWGTAKFGFDGMLQNALPEADRGRAFTVAESVFQIAWVVGALLPVLPLVPTGFGLAGAGLVALVIQVVYVTLVLLPEAARRMREGGGASDGEEGGGGDVLDLL